jgi:hypothetical protein
VSQTIPLGHRAAPPRIYAFRPHGAPQVVTVYFPGYCGTNNKSQKNRPEEIAKALAEFKKHFYGTNRL